MPIDTAGALTITPEEIKITDHLWDSFGHYETEISADWLVRFAQDRGQGWKPFTYADIEKFYSRSGKLSGFSFNKLISGGFIREIPKGTMTAITDYGDDGGTTTETTYYFTLGFVARVAESAARKAAQA